MTADQISAKVASGGDGPLQRGLQLFVSLVAGLISAAQTYRLYEGFAYRSDFLYWDPAAHAYYGVRVWTALRNFDMLQFLSTINEQTLWPPLHSVLQLPFQAFAGPSFYASAICSFVFYALFFCAIAYLYQQFSDDWFGLLVVLSLAAASPIYAGYGSMPMLEIFGAVLAAISMALYLRKSKSFPLALVLLFFLKYNYCLYVLLPVFAMEAITWLRHHTLSKAISNASRFTWFVVAYMVAMLLILITGGFKIGKLSVKGIGNPLYILLWVVVIRSLFKGRYRDYWQRIRRAQLGWFVVPVLVWMLIPIPNRVKTLVNFAVNAPLGGHHPSELSYYTFYLDGLSVYFASSWLQWACVLAAGVTVLLFRKESRVQFLLLAFLLPWLLMTANQNKQERFLFTFVFALWILFGYGVSRLRPVILRISAVAAIGASCLWFHDAGKVHDYVAWPFIPVAAEGPVEFIAKTSSVAAEVRVLGVSNELNPALLQYHSGRLSAFRSYPHFEWELEKEIPQDAVIIGINQEVPAGKSEVRSFPGGYRISVARMR